MTIKEIRKEFKERIRFANGYQINTSDYENIHILQTLDLRSITANHKAVKEMMEAYLS